MILVWFGVLIAGLVVALLAARAAVRHAKILAYGLAVPPFVIGMTLLAVGTDLPEVANSIIASLAGHGDLNVGDSVGSTATQITLVLGLLPLVGGAFEVGRQRIAVLGGLTVVALGLGTYFVSDGFLSRLDGGLLLVTWVAASYFAWRFARPAAEPSVVVTEGGGRLRHGLSALGLLAVVGAGSAASVAAFVNLSALLSIPEYLISFFAASLGTSLPELVVDLTALREQQRDLAVGDVFGSSLVDASLSMGVGPLIAPTVVTAELAVRGAITAALAVGVASLLLLAFRRHSRWTGAFLLLAYFALYLSVL